MRRFFYVAKLLARVALRRWWVRVALGALVALGAWSCYVALRPSPGDSLTPVEVDKIYAVMRRHVKEGGPNHLHMRRLYYYAPPFAKARGANVDAVRAAALLHDATKEDGEGAPKERFCTHGDQGAELTEKTLQEMRKSEAFTRLATTAVREHMGPCGFNWRWLSRRFMSKFCGRSYPKPTTAESEVLYDIDMLDLMTVDGVVKVAELRQTNPEFGKEPLEASVKTGDDSAWKSVVDAKQTLLTPKAVECGEDLGAHTKAFVDGIDFKKVTDVAALKKAAADYLEAHPTPACLPAVPPWDGGTSP